MTGPAITADLVGKITDAYREHAAEEAEAPMPDPNEIPVPDPGKADDIDRIIREGDELARQLMEQEGSPEHGRSWLPERERTVDPESGPGHYAEASRYARQAAEALRSEEVPRAQALAAIGQIHATLAAASAAALHEEYADIRDWRNVTGQEGR